jgi:outer membrane receptor for ferrienterochelin and colicins
MKRVLRIYLLLSLLFSYPACIYAQKKCDENQIYDARVQYDIGKFTECVNLLKPCLGDNGFHNENKMHALELCAMCYLSMDSIAVADHYIEQLVTIDDNYKGDATGNPDRLKLEVAYIRIQLRALLTSSVSKKAEKIELAPATMQIITAEDIENRGYMDLESVFYDLPGFDISRNYGITYSVFYQRGYRSPALTERTLILVDGVEDNDVWSNSAYISKQYPLSNVKRIEVIYGPASTLYGSNAFCGVINVITKDESDIFEGSHTGATSMEHPKNAAINLQTGYGSYNTKYVDGTASVRHKDVFFSVTGRIYTSNGTDLSSDSRWDGKPDVSQAAYSGALAVLNTPARSSYLNSPYFQVKGDSIVPTLAGINRAKSLDSAGYYANYPKYNNLRKFANGIDDFCISAKLVINNFKFGIQYWNRDEGAVGDFVDINASVNSANSNWQVRQYFMYAGYDQKLSEHLSLSNLTYYEYSDLGSNTHIMHFNGYADRVLSNDSLIKGVQPIFKPTYYAQQSNLFRSEFKIPYLINEYFDVLAGTSFTTGVDQGNYVESSTLGGIQNGLVPGASTLLGGNNFTEYTLSGYLTGSYHNRRLKLNIDAGGRVDNNRFRDTSGYGTVFNPRYDVVFYPGKFIFKAIYSQAFMDASPLNKFSTSATRLLDNPTLKPEKVTNLEVSARYRFYKNNYVEMAGYRAYYTHSLGYVYVPSNGVYTSQYQDIGESLVYGLQVASEIFINKSISIFGNLTYTDPHSTYNSAITGKDSVTLRTGDIASISANAGVNVLFKKHLNVNVRVNIVGDKPTGASTSITGNPLNDIPGYQLLSATIGYRFEKNYLIQFGCNNILNTMYYSPGVRDANDFVYPSSVPQPLRNYYIKATISLKK